MSGRLQVTAAIIYREVGNVREYLITQRLPDKAFAEMWEFPGGKPKDENESLEVCLAREILEELGIVIKVREFFYASSYDYANGIKIDLHAFHCDYVSGEIQKIEVKDFKWLTLAEMGNYEMPESDLPIVEKLISLQ